MNRWCGAALRFGEVCGVVREVERLLGIKEDVRVTGTRMDDWSAVGRKKIKEVAAYPGTQKRQHFEDPVPLAREKRQAHVST